MTKIPQFIPRENRKQAQDLRHNQTPAEKKPWGALRHLRASGYHFRRQHPIPPYIVDFVCLAARLVIEIDGDSHAENKEYDTARTQFLANYGLRVLRFTNTEVYENVESVIAIIQSTLPPPLK
jgi:very-short-patch-repair endonuclease